LRGRAVAFTLAAALTCSVAHAEPSAADVERSKELFASGRKLVESGRCDVGAPILEESLRLNESIGARVTLAQCARRPIEAWTHLKMAELVAVKNGDPRIATVHDRLAALEQQVALVQIDLGQTARNVPGLELRVDQSRIDPTLWRAGTIAVEPGRRVLEAMAPGKRRWTREVDARSGVVAVVPITMEDDGSPAALPPPPPSKAPKEAPKEEAPKETAPAPEETSEKPLSRAGLVVAGAGLLAIGTATFFGLSAMSRMDESREKHCGSAINQRDSNRCDPQGLDLRESAVWRADLSSALFALGGVALAAGVALVIVPRVSAKSAGTIRIMPGLGSLHLTGTL
jgi:hypothetical protein